MDLKSIYQLVSSDNHVHCVASYDGAYRFRSGQSAVAFRYCFSSVIPIPVKFYLMTWLVTVVSVVMSSG